MTKPTYDKHFCPCAKYLVLTIENEEDAREFSRFFFSRCRKKEVPEELYIQVYSAAYNGNSVNVDTDVFYSYDGEKVEEQSYIDLILNDIRSREDEFDDCREYCAYKVYDGAGPSKSRLCKICEKFNNYDYCNALIEEDYALIRYIAGSREHLNQFCEDISSLKDKDNPFRSLVDLAWDVKQYPKPVVVSLFNTVFSLIKVTDLQDAFYGEGGTLDDGQMRTALENLAGAVASELSRKEPVFKEFMETKGNLWEPLFGTFVDQVVDAVLYTKQSYDESIDNHSSLYWTTRKARVKKSAIVSPVEKQTEPELTQLTFFDLLNASESSTTQEQQDLPAPKLEEPEQAISEAIMEDLRDFSFEDFVENAGDSVPVEEQPAVPDGAELGIPSVPDAPLDFGNNIPSPASAPAEPLESEPSVAESPVPESSVVGDTTEPEEASAPPIEQEDSSNSNISSVTDNTGGPKTDESDTEARRRVVNPRPKLAGTSGRTVDDIYVPHYPVYQRENIEQIFDNVLRVKTMYLSEDSIVDKSSRYLFDALAIEVLYVKGQGWVLVFCSKKDKNAWFCPIGDIPSGLKKVLVSNKIPKVCYEPYLLYSTLRSIGVRARNCYSLLNMDPFLKTVHGITDISDMERKYLGIIPDEHPLDDLGLTIMTKTHLMQYLKLYYFQESVGTAKSKTRIKTQLLRDEVLGYSYMRETFLSDESVLFIRGEKGLLFNNSFVHSSLIAGYFVTYFLRSDVMSNSDKQRMYLFLLTELLSKGMSRKHDFFIVSFSNGTMTLFVPQTSYTTITEMIHERMDMFAMDNDLSGYTLDVVEEFVEPVGTDYDDEERYQRAVRHNDRINEMERLRKASDFIDHNLLDYNNSITVKDGRIKVRAVESKDGKTTRKQGT